MRNPFRSFCSIAVLAVGAFAADVRPAVNLLSEKAQSLEARGRDDLAAQVWQQVLVADPDHLEALAHLARWTKRNGQLTQSTVYLARLRKLSPEAAASAEAPAREAAGNGKLKGQLDEAMKLAAAGHYDDAMRIYREAFGAKPPAGAWATAYYETLASSTGGYDAAVNGLRQLEESYPASVEYKLSLAKLLTYRPATRLAGAKMLADVSGFTGAGSGSAKAAWRQALLWEKQNAAFADSARLYLSRYTDSEVETATASMRNRQPVPVTPPRPQDKQILAGYDAMRSGALDEADKHFHQALEVDKTDHRALEGLGFVAMKRRNFDAAVQSFEAARPATGGSDVRNALGEARFWKTMQAAEAAAGAQDWKAAIALYQQAEAERRGSREALNGLGGAYLAAGQPTQALPYLRKAVELDASNASAWCNYVKASLESSGPQSALRVIGSVPAGTEAALTDNMDWKALTALVRYKAGDSDQALSMYRDLLSAKTDDLPASAQVNLASLSLEVKQPREAAIFAQHAVDLAPKNDAAWELLFSSLIASGRVHEAGATLDKMPVRARAKASTHPGFQQALASLKEANGDSDGARNLLEALLQKGQLPEQSRIDIRLHLADLDSKLGSNESAIATLNELAAERPEDLNILRTRLLLLNRMGRQAEVIDAFSNAPQGAVGKLRQQGDMVSVLAGAYAATGKPETAIRLLETYTIGGDEIGKSTQRLQLAWLLLDQPDSSAGLYRLLDSLGHDGSLDRDGHKQVEDIWATWILRSAEQSRKTGDAARALAILENGARTYPGNAKLQAAYAGNLLMLKQARRALNVYCNWGLQGGQPDDYAGAIGAALSEHNTQWAETWTESALNQWPNNARILSLAGDLAHARGDSRKARALWQQALAQREAQPPTAMQADANVPESSLRSLLVGSTPEATNSGLRATDDNLPVHFSSYEKRAEIAAPARVSGALPMVRNVRPAQEQSLEDKIASLDGSTSPYLSSRTSVWGRGGQAGFDRLLIEQAEFEGSTTLLNNLKASFILRPTYLSNGSANGSGTALFGTQKVPASLGPQSASGVAAETQLSNDLFGLEVGSTPRGFLLHDWVGGLRVSPFGGHLGLVLQRDQVRDTMLSYAGVRDPGSGKVWGGVMSDSANLQTRWGSTDSGIYASGGYQVLDGTNVTRNQAISGNLGAWWKVLGIPSGDLTVGINFSAMHYDKNLRFFTFGQGGYFSPQQYFLFNVPVHYSGAHGQFEYSFGGSLGLQHFVEDPSGSGQFPAFISTGANFNFDGRLGYQISPHWLMGAFVTASNARNYVAASAGIFAKYTFDARPMHLVAVPAAPADWKGQPSQTF